MISNSRVRLALCLIGLGYTLATWSTALVRHRQNLTQTQPGFSGTNDSRDTHPQGVKQLDLPD